MRSSRWRPRRLRCDARSRRRWRIWGDERGARSVRTGRTPPRPREAEGHWGTAVQESGWRKWSSVGDDGERRRRRARAYHAGRTWARSSNHRCSASSWCWADRSKAVVERGLGRRKRHEVVGPSSGSSRREPKRLWVDESWWEEPASAVSLGLRSFGPVERMRAGRVADYWMVASAAKHGCRYDARVTMRGDLEEMAMGRRRTGSLWRVWRRSGRPTGAGRSAGPILPGRRPPKRDTATCGRSCGRRWTSAAHCRRSTTR